MNKKLIRKMQTAAGGPLFPWLLNTEWVNGWKFRTTPASRSRVLSGKGVETDKQYTERRKKETTKRTWRSDASDVAHGIGEGVLALHPYTAIPYFGAKVGLDFLNGTYGWHTALNASVPLFHLAPQAVGLREATNVALEDAANAGSKTARNWRVAREINLATKNKPNIEVPKSIIRTRVGDVEIDNPQLFYRQGSAEMGNDFIKSGVVRTSGGFENPMYTEGALFRKVPTRTKGGLSKGDKVALDGPYSKNKSDLLVTDSSIDMIPADQGSGKNYAWFEDYMLDPFAEESIFDRSRVPLFDNTATSTNTTIYRWKPRYGYRKVIQEPRTSLKFFERKPAKISEAERLGKPKGDRNNKKNINTDNIYGNLRFIRNIDGLPTVKDGLVQLGNSDKLLTNFTTDLPFRLHAWYPNIPGPTYMIVSPRAFKGKRFFSIKPSDSFLDTREAKVTPNLVRIVSGNPKILREAENKGMRTLTSDKLQDLFKLGSEVNLKEYDLGMNGAVRNFLNADRAADNLQWRDVHIDYPKEGVVTPYRAEVDKLITLNFGRPSIKDYLTLLNVTGLDAGVTTKFNPEFLKNAIDPLANKDMFNGVYYSVTSPIEELLMNSIGLYSGPYYNFSNWLRLSKLKGNKLTYKQGGKMNILEFLKNGSGIHIKKKNRGKFTSYCGGKVTDECILKGKNSSNPAIRKRATFAANARKWKHKFGGLINKFLQGGAGWGLLASGVVNAGMLLYAANKLANAEKESAYANNKLNYQNLQELIVKDAIEKMNQEKKKWLEQYLSGQSLDNSWRSDAFTNYVLQLIINQKLVGAKNKLKQLNALAEAEAESEKTDAMNSAFSSVIQNGLGTLISNLGNKKITDNSVNTYNSNNFRGTPDSSDKVYTTPSGISNTVDEWRNLIIR